MIEFTNYIHLTSFWPRFLGAVKSFYHVFLGWIMKKLEAIFGVFSHYQIYIMWKFPKFRKLGVPWGIPGHHPSHDHDLVGLSIFRSPMLRNHSKLGICFQLSNMVTNLVTHFGMFSLTLVTPSFCPVGASNVTRVLSSRPRPKSPFWKLFLDEMGGRKHPGERPGLPIISNNHGQWK